MRDREQRHPTPIASGVLQKAIDLARAVETADKDVKDLQGSRAQPAMTEVHAVTQKRGGEPHSVGTPCYRCGGKHSARACRFKTSVCHTGLQETRTHSENVPQWTG